MGSDPSGNVWTSHYIQEYMSLLDSPQSILKALYSHGRRRVAERDARLDAFVRKRALPKTMNGRE